MGYDFMFQKAKDLSNLCFPCKEGEFDLEERSFPWQPLKQHLLSLGAVEQDFSEFGLPSNYRWEIEGKGAIYVDGNESYASLDTHADWCVVLDLFFWLREIDPRIVLADPSVGNYYDPESFRRFIADVHNA